MTTENFILYLKKQIIQVNKLRHFEKEPEFLRALDLITAELQAELDTIEKATDKLNSIGIL